MRFDEVAVTVNSVVEVRNVVRMYKWAFRRWNKETMKLDRSCDKHEVFSSKIVVTNCTNKQVQCQQQQIRESISHEENVQLVTSLYVFVWEIWRNPHVHVHEIENQTRHTVVHMMTTPHRTHFIQASISPTRFCMCWSHREFWKFISYKNIYSYIDLSPVEVLENLNRLPCSRIKTYFFFCKKPTSQQCLVVRWNKC